MTIMRLIICRLAISQHRENAGKTIRVPRICVTCIAYEKVTMEDTRLYDSRVQK